MRGRGIYFIHDSALCLDLHDLLSVLHHHFALVRHFDQTFRYDIERNRGWEAVASHRANFGGFRYFGLMVSG